MEKIEKFGNFGENFLDPEVPDLTQPNLGQNILT